MSNSDYIYDFELENIQTNNCKQIENYIKLREKWLVYYEEFGIKYPLTSDNNFRDSWFHYRKIYKERSKDEAVREIANFEEHLQRAERDLAVKFLQDISCSLEKWYLYGLKEQKLNIDKSVNFIKEWNKCFGCFDSNNIIKREWANSLYDFCRSNNKNADEYRENFSVIFYTYVWNDKFKYELQKMLHKIKNIVLQVRLCSTEIDRTDSVGRLTERCSLVIDELLEFCKQYYIKEVVFLGV